MNHATQLTDELYQSPFKKSIEICGVRAAENSGRV